MFLCICISLHAPLYGAEGTTTKSKLHHNTHTTRRKKKSKKRTWKKLAEVSIATAVTASLLYMLTRNGSSKKAELPETPITIVVPTIPAQNIPSTPQSTHETLPVETSAYDRCILDNLFFFYKPYSKIDKRNWSNIIEFVETSSLSSEQKLIVHVLHQDHQKSKQLIDAKADVSYSPQNYFTALHIATYKSDEEMVTLLIKAGANVNKACGFLFNEFTNTITSSSSDTKPLYHAFDPTYNEVILQHLVEAKAEINASISSIYDDALSYAISHHRTNAVKYLLEQKADVQKTYGRDQFSIVHRCAITPNIDIMKLLIKAGATPDQQSIDLLARKNQDQHNTTNKREQLQSCLALLSSIPQA